MIKGLFTEKEQMLYTSALLLVHPAGIEPTTFGVGVNKFLKNIMYYAFFLVFFLFFCRFSCVFCINFIFFII